MLRIPRALYNDVVRHCQSRYPKEACGLLAGPKPAGAARVVAQVYPMTNVEDSPIGYSMDPREQLRVEKQMRLKSQQLVGIYHSHTATDAYPSPVDVRLAISPEVSYVLISLKDREPDFKSYLIHDGAIAPEPVDFA